MIMLPLTNGKYIYWRIFIYMLLVLFFVSTSTGVKSKENICFKADAYLKADLFEKALTEYGKLLINNPSLNCAIKGLKSTKKRALVYYINLGNSYREISDSEHAIKFYKKALNIDPGNEEVEANIKELIISPIRQYVNQGKLDEAESALDALLNENKVRHEDVSNDLIFLLDSKELSKRKVKLFYKDWGEITIVIFSIFRVSLIFISGSVLK